MTLELTYLSDSVCSIKFVFSVGDGDKYVWDFLEWNSVGGLVKGSKIVSMGVKAGFIVSAVYGPHPQRTPCAAAGTTGPPVVLLESAVLRAFLQGLNARMSPWEVWDMTDSSLVETHQRFGAICAGKMEPELEEVLVEDSVRPMAREVISIRPSPPVMRCISWNCGDGGKVYIGTFVLEDQPLEN